MTPRRRRGPLPHVRALRRLGACREAVAWAGRFATWADVWRACPRPDWLLWVVTTMPHEPTLSRVLRLLYERGFGLARYHALRKWMPSADPTGWAAIRAADKMILRGPFDPRRAVDIVTVLWAADYRARERGVEYAKSLRLWRALAAMIRPADVRSTGLEALDEVLPSTPSMCLIRSLDLCDAIRAAVGRVPRLRAREEETT